MADVHQNPSSGDSVQQEQDSRRKRRGAAYDQDEHKEDTGPPSKFRKFDGNQDGRIVTLFRRPEKDVHRWNVPDVVSDYTLKYFNYVLDEESFKEMSEDIGKPDNELLAPLELNDVIKKAD